MRDVFLDFLLLINSEKVYMLLERIAEPLGHIFVQLVLILTSLKASQSNFALYGLREKLGSALVGHVQKINLASHLGTIGLLVLIVLTLKNVFLFFLLNLAQRLIGL